MIEQSVLRLLILAASSAALAFGLIIGVLIGMLARRR